MRAAFLGPPGVGKGTQAVRLGDKLGLVHICTGDILRQAVAEKTEVGLEAKRYMDAGDLVPDEVVVRVMEERLERADCTRGYILDGFPRTVAQGQALDKVLHEHGQALDKVIFVNAPDDVLVKRLSGRRTCSECGAVFHVDTLPPKVDGICDNCQKPLVLRDDDRAETVRERLRVYHNMTAPLIDYYRDQGLLIDIPGERDIDEVQSMIEEQFSGTIAT